MGLGRRLLDCLAAICGQGCGLVLLMRGIGRVAFVPIVVRDLVS